MKEESLVNNKTYAAIFFDWKFNTVNGFCPPNLERQFSDYRKVINNTFHLLHNESVLILKDSERNQSIIETAIAFKNILKCFPMMTSAIVATKHFKVASLNFDAEMSNLISA